MADEPLKVEVGQLIRWLQRKKLLELCIRENVATILRILKIVLADVRVNLTGHLSARHHGSLGAAQELGKLITDKRRLDEATGSTSRTLVLALARGLLSSLQVALGLLLKHLQLGYEGAKLLAHAVKLLKASRVSGLVLDRLLLHLRLGNRRNGNRNSLRLRSRGLLGHYTLIRGICLSLFLIYIF